MTHPLDLFSIPFPYTIDVSKLTQTYIELQKKWHPDRFVNASPVEQKRATEQTSLLNKAYGLLRNPLSCCEAILTHLNAPLNQKVSHDVLEKQMMYREKLASLDREEMTEFYKHIEEEYQSVDHLFYRAIEAHDLTRAVALFHWMTYLARLRQQREP